MARTAIALVALLLIVLFVVENAQTVPIHFLVGVVNTSLAWALFVAGVLGVTVGLLAPYVRRRP